MLLLDFGRELGLPLRGLHMGRHVGWTTDKAKADTVAGAWFEHVRTVPGADGELEQQTYTAQPTVQFVPSLGKDADARRFDGWEISFPVGAEVCDAARVV